MKGNKVKCLTCKKIICEKNLFAHLKTATHKKNVKRISKIKKKI